MFKITALDTKAKTVTLEWIDNKSPVSTFTTAAPSNSTKWTKINNYTEAQTALSKFGIGSEFTDDLAAKVKGSNKAQTISIVNAIGEEFEEIYIKRPEVFNKSKLLKGINIIIEDTDAINVQGIKASGYYDYNTMQIRLAGKRKLGSNLKFGEWVVGSGITDTFRHELGHVIYDISLNVNEKKLFSEAIKKLGGVKNLKEISTYAGTNIQEAFAECFSVWMHPNYGSINLRLNPYITDAFNDIFKVKTATKTVSVQKAIPAHSVDIKTGTVIKNTILEGGSNEARLITLQDNDITLKGVFKPVSGENWDHGRKHISNKTFSFAEREALASDISEKINFGYVPKTVLREINGKQGSIQLFVNNTTEFAELSTKEIASQLSPSDVFELSVFDYLIGNSDRHAYNLLVTSNNQLVAIDNGLSFGSNTKNIFLSAEKRFITQKYTTGNIFANITENETAKWANEIPSSTISKLSENLNKLDIDEITKNYNISNEEKFALKERLRWLKQNINNSKSYIKFFETK